MTSNNVKRLKREYESNRAKVDRPKLNDNGEPIEIIDEVLYTDDDEETPAAILDLMDMEGFESNEALAAFKADFN